MTNQKDGSSKSTDQTPDPSITIVVTAEDWRKRGTSTGGMAIIQRMPDKVMFNGTIGEPPPRPVPVKTHGIVGEIRVVKETP